MFLSYDEIIEQLNSQGADRLRITPFNAQQQINAASVTLRLGHSSTGIFDDEFDFGGGHEEDEGAISRESFAQALTMERVSIPKDMIAILSTPSLLARHGVNVTQGSILVEPGWDGHIQLEITNFGPNSLPIRPGTPIVNVAFARLGKPTSKPYDGRFQLQGVAVKNGGIEGRQGILVPKWTKASANQVIK